MQKGHGLPLSERERAVLKEYDAEAEMVCQLVVSHGPGTAEVVCYAVGLWLVECRACTRAFIVCDTHASFMLRGTTGARCKHCGTRADTPKGLYVVRPFPAGAL